MRSPSASASSATAALNGSTRVALDEEGEVERRAPARRSARASRRHGQRLQPLEREAGVLLARAARPRRPPLAEPDPLVVAGGARSIADALAQRRRDRRRLADHVAQQRLLVVVALDAQLHPPGELPQRRREPLGVRREQLVRRTAASLCHHGAEAHRQHGRRAATPPRAPASARGPRGPAASGSALEVAHERGELAVLAPGRTAASATPGRPPRLASAARTTP